MPKTVKIKKDYPELEGKNVIVVRTNDTTKKGIVAGVNYDIGISIDFADNSGRHFLCLHGPSFDKSRSNYTPASYKTEFYTCVAMIKKGIVDINILKKVELAKAGKSHDTCFGIVGTCAYTG